MRLEIVNNLVVAKAESTEEGQQLLSLASNTVAVPSNRPKKYKKHKKHNHKKDCPVCGMEGLKGMQGLANHMGRMHHMTKEQRELAIAQGTRFLESREEVRIPVVAG